MNFIKSLCLWCIHGILGGWLCGSIVILFILLDENSGTFSLGTLVGCLGLGLLYGSMIGYVVLFVTRITLFKISDQILEKNRWKLALITTISGSITAIALPAFNPFLPVLAGVGAFWGGVVYFGAKDFLKRRFK